TRAVAMTSSPRRRARRTGAPPSARARRDCTRNHRGSRKRRLFAPSAPGTHPLVPSPPPAAALRAPVGADGGRTALRRRTRLARRRARRRGRRWVRPRRPRDQLPIDSGRLLGTLRRPARDLTDTQRRGRLRLTRGERQPLAAREGRHSAPARVSFCVVRSVQLRRRAAVRERAVASAPACWVLQRSISPITPRSARPERVRVYSTRGGISAYWARVTMPARSSSARRRVSTLSLRPGTEASRAEKRRGPSRSA